MRLTTKGRFAVTAMIDLALRQDQGPVTLAGISQRQKISLSYLEQLFGKLRRHEIVESVRGPGGGYNLSRRTENISVADIIVAVDEPLDATQCGGKGGCHKDDEQKGPCMTHELWSTLNEKMVEYLDSVSLHDLVAKQKGREPNTIQNIHTFKGTIDRKFAEKIVEKEPEKRHIVNSVFALAQSQ